jgi:tRNA dimethylallyltransferase
MANTPHPRVICLAGPTASGKSEVAVCLAEKVEGEIVTVDSMQVYRGLDIGTAKPTSEERRSVPHHLIDVAEITENFDAARFVRLAGEAVEGIKSRGKTAILCGGTGLYFKAFMEGLGDAPPADAALRAKLEATPVAELLAELERLDAAAFATIDRKNPRRIIRAVEVLRLTGKPFSEQRAGWRRGAEGSKESAVDFIGLRRSSEDLRTRIDERVERMFRNGLVRETEGLLKRGLAENKTAMQAIGYRQVVEHLRGERGLAETIELVKVRTRQFAKRQMTWFRRQAGVDWVRVELGEGAGDISRHVMVRLGAGAPEQQQVNRGYS